MSRVTNFPNFFLLFGNFVDACVINTDISKMKSSIGVVVVRSFVPV